MVGFLYRWLIARTDMPKLANALAAWNSPAFARALKTELENLSAGSLPLHQGVSQGGYVDDRDITALVLRFADAGTAIEAKVGIFFTEIVGGGGCPIEPIEQSAYCELMAKIDKSTAETEFLATPN